MVLGVAAFSVHDMLGKIVVERYPVAQMLALRAGIATVLLLGVTVRTGVPRLAREAVPGQALRLGLMLGALFMFFTALREMPLADAIAIALAAPFVMLALSRPVLGEHVPRAAWGAVAVGFVGVLIVVRPTGDGIEPAALLALGSIVLYALGMLVTRRVGRTQSEFSLIFWMIAGQLVASLLVAPFVWRPVEARDWFVLGALAAVNLLGHVGLTRAFARAPVAAVAPLEYSALVWAAVLGFVVFGEVPSVRVIAGSALIVGAGIFATVRRRSGDLSPDRLGP
jgi:drug/metabolite transporter (DMT)-like permease